MNTNDARTSAVPRDSPIGVLTGFVALTGSLSAATLDVKETASYRTIKAALPLLPAVIDKL